VVQWDQPSANNASLSAAKMGMIEEIPADKRELFQQFFHNLDKNGDGHITLEDSPWAAPFLEANDIDGDGAVSLNEWLFIAARKLADDPDWLPSGTGGRG